MRFYTNLFLNLVTFCSFLTNTSQAQAEKDYFITLWDLSIEKSTTIEFFAETSGEVNYTWETVPAGESGSGTFSGIEKKILIDMLPANAKIKLKIAPQNLQRFYFSNGYNDGLIDVLQWGTAQWTSMEKTFFVCRNLNITAPDVPDLSQVSSLNRMFSFCSKLNGPTNIGTWNTQNVKDMSGMFQGASYFNQPIGTWNTQNITNMSAMFSSASSFNQPIGIWNIENVTDLSVMFWGADSFNQPIGLWKTQNVKDMNRIFYGATSFNQAIGTWNTQNVTDMSEVFRWAKSFNQPIGAWNTQKVTNMSSMFYEATSFNQAIGTWNTENVTNMRWMFAGDSSFNQAIGTWNTQNVTDMGKMFLNAKFFNQAIGTWNTQNVTNMGEMFHGARYFNHPIGTWNTQNVTDMSGMFANATSFNQPVGSWNTQHVTAMNGMFSGASSFNQAIGTWNTQNVTSVNGMFYGASSFNQPIGLWNTENVTDMRMVFNRASTFNQSIGLWNTQKVTVMWGIIDYCGMDCNSYSSTLMGWANNSETPNGLELSSYDLKYSILAKPARDLLTKPVAEGGKGWKIYGDELSTEDCGLLANEEGAEQSNIALYPNPAQETLYLKNAPLGTKYSIFDGLGRLVSTGQCQNEAIDISALSSGLYSLRIGNKPFNFIKE